MSSGRRPDGPSRPTSQPAFTTQQAARINSAEPYRHRSLPPGESPGGSNRPSSEQTFAVLYDDAGDYQMGHYDDKGSIKSGRPGSMQSVAPSYRSRGSVEYHAHNWPLSQDHQHAQAALGMDLAAMNHSRNPSTSEETLALTDMKNNYAKQDYERLNNASRNTFCTCHDDHDRGSKAFGHDYASLHEVDMEHGHTPATPTFPQGSGFPPTEPKERNIVTFEGPDDPYNPKNWPSKKRWAATFVMASFTFISPLTSSMVAPALGKIQEEFKIQSDVEVAIILSIFVLAYAIGPLILGPLSELYGRVVVLQASNVLFLAFNIGCGFAQTKQQLMAFRFLAGLGGSAPLAIGGGVLGDLFHPEERGKAMGLYAMGPLLGPALGPVAGGFVALKTTWRWMFWATSIADGAVLISGFFFLKESYAPFLLHQKAKRLRKETGNPFLKTEYETDHTVIHKLLTNIARSFKMLFTQPIVQVLALYMAYAYGLMYLVLSSYPRLWEQKYGENVGVAGLNYISLGIGFFFGAPLCGKTNDVIYRKLKAKNPRGEGKPEFRMPLMIPFSFLVPIGLLIYGWSAQAKLHWIVPNIGAAIFGMGTIAAFQCVTTYLVDAYARYAASAVAAVTVLRSLAGFGFPLFANYMYNALDYGWGNTVLAIAGICIGFPAPVLLWLFGEKLRKRSQFAQGRR